MLSVYNVILITNRRGYGPGINFKNMTIKEKKIELIEGLLAKANTFDTSWRHNFQSLTISTPWLAGIIPGANCIYVGAIDCYKRSSYDYAGKRYVFRFVSVKYWYREETLGTWDKAGKDIRQAVEEKLAGCKVSIEPLPNSSSGLHYYTLK